MKEQNEQINEIKARIMNLQRKQPGNTLEDAIRWLGIDNMTMADIKANLNKTASRQYPIGEPIQIASDPLYIPIQIDEKLQPIEEQPGM